MIRNLNMKRGYRYAGVAVMGLLIGSAVAGGKTRLLGEVYDFGAIREVDGSVTGKAYVINEGPEATYVRDVRPSCGCTGATYDTSVLNPGDTTEVTFTYNPIGRPGTINKTVKIYVGDNDERHIVRLTGRVVGSPETLSRNYPVACGPIRLSDSIVDMGKIAENSGRHAFVRIINATVDTVRPVFYCDNPALLVDLTPTALLPGDVGTLGIYLNTKFTETLGRVDYRVPVWTESDTTSRVAVSIRALIEPEAKVEAQADTVVRKPLF